MATDLEHHLSPTRPGGNSEPETATHAAAESPTLATTIGTTTTTPRTSTENSETNNNVDCDPAVIKNEDEDECRTPTSEEYMIPKLTSPPPAPRKKRVRNEDASCKKKLMPEFEKVVRYTIKVEDLEKLFRSRFDDLEEERLGQRRKVLLPSS